MKRLALIMLGTAALTGCTGFIHFRTVAVVEAPPPPPPPPVDATITVGASTAPDTNASADVEVAPPVTADDPDELTATSEPPDPLYEEQLDSPGPGYYWVGGYWGWTGTDWGWYSGRWLQPPEGRVYVEPYYERVGPNVVYVRGYWGPPNAPHRSYGGERIRFAAAARPEGYHRGDRPHFQRMAGAPPGSRGPHAYEHASGQVRPLPHATMPSYRVAARGDASGHGDMGARGDMAAHGDASGHGEPGRDMGHEPGHDAAPMGHDGVARDNMGAAAGGASPTHAVAEHDAVHGPVDKAPGPRPVAAESDGASARKLPTVAGATPHASHLPPASTKKK